MKEFSIRICVCETVRGKVMVQVSLLSGMAIIIPFPDNSLLNENSYANKNKHRICILDYLMVIIIL